MDCAVTRNTSLRGLLHAIQTLLRWKRSIVAIVTQIVVFIKCWTGSHIMACRHLNPCGPCFDVYSRCGLKPYTFSELPALKAFNAQFAMCKVC